MIAALTYLAAYLLVSPLHAALWAMRRLALRKASRPPLREWTVFFVGATERFVALTLVLLAPPYLPTFIGGWVLLKFAIGWQRVEKHDDETAKQRFFALIRSVLSFSIAIAIGVFLNPNALEVWKNATH
jgi:hypothetical protein